jgi:hypothetical protein
MKRVGKELSKRDKRRETRWLVLSFLWSKIGPVLKGTAQLRAFSEKCQLETTELIQPLSRAIDKAATVIMRFYRAKKGKGTAEIDMPKFFKSLRSSLSEFQKYLKDSPTGLAGLDKEITRLAQALRE